MTESLVLPVAGLMTDPGPFTAAPEGGLAEAQNVVVLRPGVIEPRPGGVMVVDTTLKSGGYSARAMYTDTTGTNFVWAATGGGTWIVRRGTTTTITGPTSFASGMIRTCPTGGRALSTSSNGVVTLPSQTASPASGSSTIAYRAGMPQPYAPRMLVAAAGTGMPAGSNWLPNNESTAYRVTLRRRLANGAVVESPPSGRVVITNTAGAARGIQLTGILGGAYYAWNDGAGVGAQLFNSLIVGDELCVYRAPRVAGTPSDEMKLRAVLTWNVTYSGFVDVVSGVPTPWFDGLDDSAWTGEPLYTNVSQDGADDANYRPDYARDICLYNGATFYGGATSPYTVRLTLRGIGSATSVPTDYSQKLYSFAFNGTLAIGSNVITAIAAADIRKFSVGQVITTAAQAPGAASASIPANTTVTAVNVGALTVTMSANAGTAGVTALIGWDWIESSIAGSRIYHSTGVGTLPTRYFTTSAAELDNRWNDDFATALQLRCSGDSQTDNILCTFFQPSPSDAQFSVRSSKPNAWDRLVNNTTGVTAVQEGGIAELRWSKTNEPEHVPIANRTTVGDESFPIRRIEVADNTMLIIKDDGVYQAFGVSAEEGFQFEMLDRTIALPRMLESNVADEPSKWVGKFGDRVYAMTTRGPMVIGDNGAQSIGAPVLETLRRRLGPAYGADYGQESGATRRALMVDVRSRRLGFFLATASGGSEAWIYDADMETWVYWTFAREMAAFGDRLSTEAVSFAGSYMSGALEESRLMLSGTSLTLTTIPSTCERWATETCTINTVTGTGPYTVTIAAGSEWTPQVGDLLIRSGVAHQVSAITSATVFSTLTQPTTGSATWRESYESRVVWMARAEGNVGIEKEWINVRFPFELSALGTRYVDAVTSTGRLKSVFRGYRNPTTVEDYVFASQSMGASAWPLEAAYVPTDVPQAIASDWAIQAGFSLRQASAWFSTAGLVLNYEDGGEVQR